MSVKIRRLLAIYIDSIIIEYSIKIPSYFINCKFNYMIVNIIVSIIDIILVFYFIFKKDCLIGYESIGKKIMRLKIYQDGKRLKDKKILKDRIKNTFWSFYLYPFMILHNNKSKGDIKLNTEVK